MPVKAASVPFKGVRWFSYLGFSMGALEDGRLYVPEWVLDEEDGMVQVHNDAGKDYIVKGDPTEGMLFDDAETFVRLHKDTITERVQEELESELRPRKKLEATDAR